MYRDIPEEMRALVEPVVQEHGLDLVDVWQRRGRAPWSVRVIVDTPEGDGRVDVGRCAEVSREIAAQLDAADAIPARYQLEVSSPGLDRVLAREKDFVAALGQDVRLETRSPLGGRRRFRGRLQAFGDGEAELLVDGETVAIPFAEVARARVLYSFTRDDFRKADR